MRKLGIIFGLILGMAFLLTGCGSKPAETTGKTAAPEKKVFQVGLSQFVAHPALDLDQKGFIDELAKQGFVEGDNVHIDIKNSQGDPNLAKTIADQFVADKKDVILSITTPSSQAAAMAAKGTGIPVVYIAVSDALGSGLISDMNKPTGTNITGVYSADPVEEQMDLIREIQPGIKKIGVLYNAGEANSASNVKRIKEYLKGKVEVVEATVSSSSEVQAAAQSLVGRVDAMFMPQDNTVMSAVETVIKIGQDNKIPFYTGDTESVKKGAVATMGNLD
ncbi:MAG TPA: ABC transporter substrate-binding protein, partial [Bacillota bacterium]|nr:ABC transporter substrate-binding protein [Bacillota bacterium]